MKQRWDKFALWWFHRIFFTEFDREFELTTFPDSLYNDRRLVHEVMIFSRKVHTLGLPGIPASHLIKSTVPSSFVIGLAQNPYGWSLRQLFLSSINRFTAMPDIFRVYVLGFLLDYLILR